MANNVTSYGFTGLSDLYAMRIAQAGPARVYTAIQESAAEYSRIVDTILGAWSMRTTIAQTQYELPGSGSLQPLDEWGNPLPVQPSGNYQIGFPIQGGGTAFGDNRISRALMTVEEANRLTVDALMRDKDWLYRHAMAAFLTNTSWTYNDKIGPNGQKGLGNITVQPLANADTVVYARVSMVSAPTTDNHYLAQAAAISDSANPFPTIRARLVEHPSFRGPIVAYVATDLIDSISGLTEFVEVSDQIIKYGALNDTLGDGGAARVLGPGKELLGRTKSSNIWIVEMPMLPSGYIFAVDSGGDPILRQREYPAPELQGFFPEQFSPDGNTMLNRFLRYCGFGVANRVGAVVQFIGSGTYAIPTGYSAPLIA